LSAIEKILIAIKNHSPLRVLRLADNVKEYPIISSTNNMDQEIENEEDD